MENPSKSFSELENDLRTLYGVPSNDDEFQNKKKVKVVKDVVVADSDKDLKEKKILLDYISQKVLNVFLILLSFIFIVMVICFIVFVVYVSTF